LIESIRAERLEARMAHIREVWYTTTASDVASTTSTLSKGKL
jgi:hypothetical protein